MEFIRAFLWRLGRRLYLVGRRDDIDNQVDTSEKKLLEQIFPLFKDEKEICVFDIGANIGEWSQLADSLIRKEGIPHVIHCFEPIPSTFSYLSKQFNSPSFKLNNMAISDSTGELEMFISKKEFAGTNSIYNTNIGQVKQKIQTIKFADYVSSNGVNHIHFVKCDTEGHDAKIIASAFEMLMEERIGFFQFEYNHRWVYSRSYLKDIFDLVKDTNYIIAKITRDGLEHYYEWHYELEKFFQSNFLLVHRSYIDRISKIQSGSIQGPNIFIAKKSLDQENIDS